METIKQTTDDGRPWSRAGTAARSSNDGQRRARGQAGANVVLMGDSGAAAAVRPAAPRLSVMIVPARWCASRRFTSGVTRSFDGITPRDEGSRAASSKTCHFAAQSLRRQSRKISVLQHCLFRPTSLGAPGCGQSASASCVG